MEQSSSKYLCSINFFNILPDSKFVTSVKHNENKCRVFGLFFVNKNRIIGSKSFAFILIVRYSIREQNLTSILISSKLHNFSTVTFGIEFL